MRQLPDDDRPKFERLAAVLQQDVERGELEPGDRLPPVRDLRANFAVSEGTVMHALRLLRERSVVRRDSTRGHFVREDAVEKARQSAATSGPSPEYDAIMTEIRGLRSDMQTLADRLDQLEGLIDSQGRTRG